VQVGERKEMTLFELKRCNKHNQDEEMILLYNKKTKTYSCVPSCRKCVEERSRLDNAIKKMEKLQKKYPNALDNIDLC